MSDLAQSVPSLSSTRTSDTSSPQQSSIDAVAGIAQSTVAGDSLKCEWVGCGDRLPTAEKLYDHVCEKHVGRKSTNNLNLTCGWGNCRTATVKRDHITSHIRVHVPLKPHKCDFCQKAFKRPQDLKKHVKTHAEDGNFQASPEPGRNGHMTTNGVFSGQARHVADLQHLAATASGYYPDHHSMSAGAAVYSNYGNTANASAYHGPGNHYHQSSYTTTLYPVHASSMSEYEVRKKATYDALNEFFGDVKTRTIDPGLYHAVGQRLMTLQSLPTYASTNDFSQASSVSAISASPPAPLTNHYSLPMSNIRTKNDLLHIDQFLEQLQATVYEHETQANQAAQAGIHQAGNHYLHTGLHLRSSHSPPHIAPVRQNTLTSHVLPPISSCAADITPVLTPVSSVMSYNSPGSIHSSTVSPTSRASSSAMYPTLPSVSSMSDISGSAVPSALASSFDPDSHRRYTSGILQRARSEEKDTSDPLPNIARLGVRSPSLANVDPALEKDGVSQSSSANDKLDRNLKDGESGDTDPDWLTKIRVLEVIRGMVKNRLENHIYEEDDDTDTIKGESFKLESAAEKEARSLYPLLRAVQES